MSFTYDLTTNRGQVRLILADTNPAKRLFDDGEIDVFLDMNAQDVRLAAADALDTVASSEALLRKKIGTAEFNIDSPAVAREIRKHAASLREIAVANLSEDAFDIAEQVFNVFSARDLAYKEAARSGS